jgi:hypothetical protein
MQIDCLAQPEAQAPARDENSFGNLYLSRQLSLNGGQSCQSFVQAKEVP